MYFCSYKKRKVMKLLLQMACLMVLCCLTGCKKDAEDYMPPTKGNVPNNFFVESTWEVKSNTVYIPDNVSDFCMSYLQKIYFGAQTCILTAKGEVKREYKGTYHIENIDGNSTVIYLDRLVNGTDTIAYVLSVDELNTSRSSTSIVLDLISSNALPKKHDGGNYGSFRLAK